MISTEDLLSMNKFDQLYEMLISEAPISSYIAAAKGASGYGAPGFKANIASKLVSGAGSLASKAVGAVGQGLGIKGKAVPGTGALQAGIQSAAGAAASGLQQLANLNKAAAAHAQDIEKQRMYRDRDPKTGENIDVNLRTKNNQPLFPRGDYKITNTPKLGQEQYVDVTMPNNNSLRMTLPKQGEYSNVYVFQDGKPLRDPQYLQLGGNLYYSNNEKKWKFSSEERLPAYMTVPKSQLPGTKYNQNQPVTIKDKTGRIIRGVYGGESSDPKGNVIVTILDPEYN